MDTESLISQRIGLRLMAELYTLGKSEVFSAQAYTVDVTGDCMFDIHTGWLMGRKVYLSQGTSWILILFP